MKVLDVNPFHSGLQRNMAMLDRLEIEMKNIETAVNGLVGMEDTLKGEGGSAIRSFYEECHLPLIQFFRVSQRNLKSTLATMDSALNGLEPNDNGFISQSFLEGEVEEGLTDISRITSSLTDEANDIMDQVSDIVSLRHLDDTDVQEGIQNAKKKRDMTVTDLNEFDAVQTQALMSFENDLETIATWITNLETIFKEGLTDVDFQSEKWAALREKSRLETELEQNQGTVDGVPSADDVERNREEGSEWKELVAKGVLSFSENINNQNPMKLAGLFQISRNLSPAQKRQFRKTGTLSFLTREEYRQYNNWQSLNMHKYSAKELTAYLKENKKRLLAKGGLNDFIQEWGEFGENRGKNAMIKKFEELYEFDKYKEFNKLVPTKRMTVTLLDETVGKRLKSVKSAYHSAKEWKDPKAALKSSVESIKKSGTEFKKANSLNKIGKVVGKSLGPLSAGIIIHDNVSKYKGDNQKIAVGIAVDGVASAGATAIGAVVGSVLFPGVGTVAGAAIGAVIGAGINKKWGDPPERLTDKAKDFVDKKVDSVKKASKKLGKKLTNWFK